MSIIIDKVRSRAEAQAARIASRLADKALAFGISAELKGAELRLSAWRLRARMADDPALRWIAGWLR